MPIKGLTTEVQIGAGLPQIAKLFKGSEQREHPRRPGVMIMGQDLDYFRVEFEPPFEELAETWLEMYGAAPSEFEPVYVAAATVDDAFAAWKEEWTATALLHRCDGENQVLRYDANSERYLTAKAVCAAPECQCKPVGRLNLILPEFIEAAGVLGYVAVTTHSINDILTVHRYLADVQRLYGTLEGVPFVFGRAAREISAPKQDRAGKRNGRIRVKKSLFYLHVTREFTQERLLPTLGGLLPRQGATLQLPESGDYAGALGSSAASVRSANSPAKEELTSDKARKLLGNGGPRRIETRDYAPAEAQSASDGSPSAGAKEEQEAIEPDEDLRVLETATQFVGHWRGEGLYDSQILEALGVEKVSQWTRGLKAANSRVNAWMERTIREEAEALEALEEANEEMNSE